MHSIPGNIIWYYGILLKLLFFTLEHASILNIHTTILLRSVLQLCAYLSFLLLLLVVIILFFWPGLCPPYHVAVLLNFSFFIMTPHSFDGLLFNPSYHFFCLLQLSFYRFASTSLLAFILRVLVLNKLDVVLVLSGWSFEMCTFEDLGNFYSLLRLIVDSKDFLIHR